MLKNLPKVTTQFGLKASPDSKGCAFVPTVKDLYDDSDYL